MKDWPIFKVASQVSAGANVVVRDLRAPNLEEMKALLRRLLNLADLDSLSFFEVHIEKDGETEIIVGAPNQEWPKGVPTERHTCVYSPRVPGTAPHPAPVMPGDSRSLVQVGPIGPEPQPVPLNILQALSQKSKERRAKAAAENTPKEKLRPVQLHKREVA